MNSQYFSVPIIATITIIYLVSWILSRKKVLSVVTHRKLWNMVLALCFFVSATLGTLIALRSDNALPLALPPVTRWIHVEAGIMLFLIGLFHFLWHIPYFISIIKRNKPAAPAS